MAPKMPPLMPQAPTATTIFGSGVAAQVLRKREFHIARDRTGDQQHVGMARRGDEVNAEALDVVDRVVQRNDLLLTSVAGARVHLANRQRPAEQALNRLGNPLGRLLEK